MNAIPKITDPLGKHWNQPSADEILIDDTHAVMSADTFRQLAEYSCSVPSGVYPGKMWRADNAAYHPEKVKAGLHRHWLKWFGESEKPGFVSNHSRAILLLS